MNNLAIFLILMGIGTSLLDTYPTAQITNGIIKAKLYLPDETKGYYRGARFDWAGNMPSLEYKGHQYFGQWFEKYSPTLHDAIQGPVEAFYPVGYDEAKAGEKFLKIGIGMLVKPQETKYMIATPYQIADAGTWKVKKKKDQVSFDHQLNAEGYGYAYHKTVELVKGKPELLLTHTLKNTGTKNIETNVYNHNFFVIDSTLTGPDYAMIFPYPVAGELTAGAELAKLEGNELKFLKPFVRGNNVFSPGITGFSNSSKDHEIRIENRKTGAAVKITSDKPLLKMVFWSALKTVCPEPYIEIKIKPGESFSWDVRYEFYTCDIKK